MIEAVETFRHSKFQPVLWPKFDAMNDRGDGLPTGTTWTKTVGVGSQLGFPLRLQGLAYQRLLCPFMLGWNPERTFLRAAAFGNPRASERGGLAIEAEKWSRIRRLKARETEAMPLVTRTPMALEIGRRDLTNRVW
jgi:hypothetical protein